MKKILLFSVLSFITFLAHAQTEKGNVLIGGDFDMDVVWSSSDNDVFSFNLNAISGFFVAENFALGGGVGYGFAVFNQFDFSSINMTFYPIMRYYFSSSMPVQFFLDIRPGVSIATVSSSIGEESEVSFLFRGGPGMAVFLSNDVSVDFSLNYYKDPQFSSDANVNRVGLNVGLQVFLNQSKKD